MVHEDEKKSEENIAHAKKMILFRNNKEETTTTKQHKVKRKISKIEREREIAQVRHSAKKKTKRIKIFILTEIELHLTPTPWKCIHVELFSFSSLRLTIQICAVRLFFRVCA